VDHPQRNPEDIFNEGKEWLIDVARSTSVERAARSCWDGDALDEVGIVVFVKKFEEWFGGAALPRPP
jgi:hypothetical protein